MTLSERFIRKPVMTTLITVVLVAFGMVAYTKLPISSLPTVDYPVIQISVNYPGATPATMASTCASPIENECMQINGLQSIISDNRSSSTTITMTFGLDRNVDLIAPDVQAAISRAQANLPTDLPSQPTFQKVNPSDQPIVYLVVRSDTLTPGDLYDLANQMLAKRISIISGVSQVQIYGSKAAIRIQVDPDRLAARGLALDDVAAALQSGTVSIPGGALDGRYRTFSIEPQGLMLKAAQYRELIIAYRDGAPVRLKEVANCVDSLLNDQVDIRYGTPADNRVDDKCIVMAISRRGGANTVKVAENIVRSVQEVKRILPASVNVDVLYDGSLPIKESIDDVQETIVIAIALVVLIIFLFLGRLRETLIPSLMLPIAILATFIVMLAMQFSLDTLSLMGLVLSVGFLVDDAIVVLENTVRHMDRGLKPIPAAIKSMTEISTTVISTSAALVIVFVPLVFMSGAVGRYFKEFALTVIFAIVCSTLLALTLTPMMCARMLRNVEHKNRMQKIIDAVVSGMVRGYGRALNWTLRHKFVSVIVWAACIAGTLWLFALLPKSFLPPGDSGMISGVLITPQGASSDAMARLQTLANAIVMKQPYVKSVTTVTGHAIGADQSTGYIFIALKEPKERPEIQAAVQDLTAKLAVLPDGMVFLMPIPVMDLSAGAQSTAAGSKYGYTLSGNNRAQVYEAANLLQQKMSAIPGVFGVQTSVKLTMPRLKVNLRRDRASALGIDAKQIEYALALAYAQGKTTTFYTDNDTYWVITELTQSRQVAPTDLGSIQLRSQSGALVPLGAITELAQDASPQSIPHSQQLDAATISFSIAPGIPLGTITKAVEAAAAEVMPVGVTGVFQGEAQEFQEAIASLAILIGVAVFLMYIILGILYESYIHPFTVLTTLPVAAFGGMLTLLIFGQEMSLYAYIGVFMLLGIIAKNGIMMVDFAEQEMHAGRNAFDAIYNACLIRFRPILMTGLAAIMGAVPIAVGYGADGESRIPLGLIIVGGLAFAQVVTLFVTPGIFLYMDAIQAKLFKQTEEPEDAPAAEAATQPTNAG